jgi:transcriptional regulator with XRE-family HTH domain
MTAPANPADAFTKATPLHLLDYIKLLGVEQRQIAAQLGISHTTVSLWATRRRPVPVGYRPALLQWAGVAWQQAQERNSKEVALLPTAELKVAAIEAFHAPLIRWQIAVLYEAGEVRASARKNARWLLELLEHDTYTQSDLEQMRGLYLVLGNKLDILEEMGGPQNASPPPEQTGEA